MGRIAEGAKRLAEYLERANAAGANVPNVAGGTIVYNIGTGAGSPGGTADNIRRIGMGGGGGGGTGISQQDEIARAFQFFGISGPRNRYSDQFIQQLVEAFQRAISGASGLELRKLGMS